MLAWWTDSFLTFVALAGATTLVCTAAVLRMLLRSDLLVSAGVTEWSRYAAILRTSALSTLVDFAVLNAPYALIASRYGIGPALIAFDCTMKLARITMAGSRTLAEITLPRYMRLRGQERGGEARRLVGRIVLLSGMAAAIPGFIVFMDGARVFSLLLGDDTVVPAGVAVPAAVIILTSGLYQPVAFFIGYGSSHAIVKRLTIFSFTILFAFTVALYAVSLNISEMMGVFCLAFLALLVVAGFFVNQILPRDAPERQS
jgi:hypothetical protein